MYGICFHSSWHNLSANNLLRIIAIVDELFTVKGISWKAVGETNIDRHPHKTCQTCNCVEVVFNVEKEPDVELLKLQLSSYPSETPATVFDSHTTIKIKDLHIFSVDV